jgi:hypothetical protein
MICRLIQATLGLDRSIVNLVSAQPHTPLGAAHTAVYLGAFSVPRFHQLLLVSFLQLSSGDTLPTAPSPQQAVDYTQPLLSLSALQQCQRRLSVVIAAYLSPKPFFKERGCRPSEVKGLLRQSLIRSIPPLSLRNGHALDFFHSAL